jgi:Protein of unknown function (DUF3489)
MQGPPDKDIIMAKKPVKTPKSRTSRKSAAPPAEPETKQAIVLGLLRRQNGASISEIIEATDWQPHSVRGFFAGALKKRLGIRVFNEKGADGVRRYHVAPLKP